MNGHDPTMPNYYALLISIVLEKPAQTALTDMRIINAPVKIKRSSRRDRIDERDADIVWKYRRGVRAAVIAATMHVGIATVYRALSAARVPRTRRRIYEQS